MSAEANWASLRRELVALKASVAAEIRSYPRPITACDAQFNHLLELHRLLPQELLRLEAAANDPATTIAAFVRSSPCSTELSALVPAWVVG